MASATICKIGWWRQTDDTFQPHPNCPTATIFDLNDGVTFSIHDASDRGTGLDWGIIKREVLTTGNPRTTGSRVTTSTYRENREVKIHLILGQTATFAALQTAIHNLVMTCKGISNEYPGVLQFQTSGMANPLYFDILEAHADARFQELLWIQNIDDSFVVTLTCKPFARGARVWLQNLINNPGAEAPSGPGVTVFNDTFANTNAYAVQAGGALSQDKFTYLDTVLATIPTRYYRLDETSGTTAYDAMFSGFTGTYTGGYTHNSTALLTGDTDPSVLLNGTSGYISASASGLASGNGPWTMMAVIKTPSSFPASTQEIMAFGLHGTPHEEAQIYIDSSGNIHAGTYGGDTNGYALSTSTIYHVAATWDGTTLILLVNGNQRASATPGDMTIPTSGTFCTIGATAAASPSLFFGGNIKDACFYISKLSNAQISTIAAAALNMPATATNTMTIPSGGRVAFGSPAWTAINQWQIRFRWLTGLTAQFFLHYKDSNNYLLCQMQSSTLVLINVVGGASTTLVSNSSVVLTNGMQYWLQITQFPAFSTLNITGGPFSVPYLESYGNAFVTAQLFADGGGVVGNSIVTLSPAFGQVTSDFAQYTATGAASSLAGLPQIAASGAPLAIGGNFSGVNQVQLFGPGGWTFVNNPSATGYASGAWETYAPNCYANGPVASYGAGRIDVPPAGTLNAQWACGSSGNTGNMILYGIPAQQGQILGAYAYLKAPSVSSTCVTSIGIIEYNGSGVQQAMGIVASQTGALSSYTKLSGTYTVTNVNTSYCLLYINATDAVAGASANATIWWDNACCWNQTTTGMTSMPYCELRFPQSFAMFVLSGLLGDMPAPALFSVGINIGTTAWPNGRNANFYLGRRAKFNKWAQLVTANGGNTVGFGVTPALSPTAYGGLTFSGANLLSLISFPAIPFDSAGMNPIDGTYQAFSRMEIIGASTPSAVAVAAGHGYVTASNNGQGYYYPNQYPFTASSVWTLAALGQITGNVALPSGLAGMNNYIAPFTAAQTNTNTTIGNGMVLVPVDSEYLAALLTNSSARYAQGWAHTYFDGVNRSCTFSVDVGVQSNPAAGITNTYLYSSVTPLGYSQPIVDPTLGGGINQFGFASMDSAGNLLPCCLEVIYSPQYAFAS